MTELAYARVQSHLERLKLPQMATCLDGVAQQAVKDSCTYVDFLDRLLEAEVSARYERDVAMKVKLAHFPFLKTLDAFDFAFQPSINERQIQELATLRFVAHGENVLLLGPPGVGKTHLAIALGMAAIAQAISVYFVSIVDLIEMIHKDAKEDRLGHRLSTLCRPKLLILDEMGYFSLDRQAAQFLFQLVEPPLPKGQHHPDQQQVLWRVGRHLSPTKCWPRPFWIACCTSRRQSTSAGRATACARSARRESSPISPIHKEA